MNSIRDRFGASSANSWSSFDYREWRLLRRVIRELDLDPALDLSDVDVAIDRDRVVLTGSVPGEATRARILRVVSRVEGVTGVEPRLVVGDGRYALTA